MPSNNDPAEALYLPLQGYEASVLFLIFVAITLSWECLLGILTFVNNILRGKRAHWLDRVKEEVLALGVVSLVLLFLQPVLETICVPSDLTNNLPPADWDNIPGAYYGCPPGQRNVFPATIIHASHYLLFYIAVVHIVFNMITNSISARKFTYMVAMERDARNLDVEWEQVQIQWRAKYGAGVPPPQDPLLQLPDSDDEGEPINMKAAMDRAGESAPGSVLGGGDNGSQAGGDGGSDAVEQQRTMRRADRKPKKKKKKKWLKPWRWLKRRWLLLRHSVDLRGFALLRRVCQLRFAAHSMDSNVRTFSYINVASQVLEADLEQVYAHAWLMILFMTFLLLYPRILHQARCRQQSAGRGLGLRRRAEMHTGAVPRCHQPRTQIIWANGLCLVVLLIMAIKLNKILQQEVEICRNVLLKGVHQRVFLAREEKLQQLAGSVAEEESSSSEEAGKSVNDGTSSAGRSKRSAAQSKFVKRAQGAAFVPYKRPDDDDEQDLSGLPMPGASLLVQRGRALGGGHGTAGSKAAFAGLAADAMRLSNGDASIPVGREASSGKADEAWGSPGAKMDLPAMSAAAPVSPALWALSKSTVPLTAASLQRHQMQLAVESMDAPPGSPRIKKEGPVPSKWLSESETAAASSFAELRQQHEELLQRCQERQQQRAQQQQQQQQQQLQAAHGPVGSTRLARSSLQQASGASPAYAAPGAPQRWSPTTADSSSTSPSVPSHHPQAYTFGLQPYNSFTPGGPAAHPQPPRPPAAPLPPLPSPPTPYVYDPLAVVQAQGSVGQWSVPAAGPAMQHLGTPSFDARLQQQLSVRATASQAFTSVAVGAGASPHGTALVNPGALWTQQPQALQSHVSTPSQPTAWWTNSLHAGAPPQLQQLSLDQLQQQQALAAVGRAAAPAAPQAALTHGLSAATNALASVRGAGQSADGAGAPAGANVEPSSIADMAGAIMAAQEELQRLMLKLMSTQEAPPQQQQQQGSGRGGQPAANGHAPGYAAAFAASGSRPRDRAAGQAFLPASVDESRGKGSEDASAAKPSLATSPNRGVRFNSSRSLAVPMGGDGHAAAAPPGGKMGKPSPDEVLDQKRMESRKEKKRRKRRQRVEVVDMHLPYHTLADLAEEVESKTKNLFWFRHPHYMLWLVNTIFLITSLSITTAVAFVIPYNKFQYLSSLGQEIWIWLPVVVADVLMAVYLCWNVLPLYALLTTAGASFPPRVIQEIRAAKTLSHEDYHGISGMVLSGLNHVFVGVETHHRKQAIDLATYFIASLAEHAGIVLGSHLRQMVGLGAETIMNGPEVKTVLKEFAQFWHDLAWYGPPDEEYNLKSDLTGMQAAFAQLDADGSGALSFGELAQMVRALGALATAGDIETMLWEVDLDGSRSVGLDEFIKFLAYAFFDADANGYIGIDELENGFKKLGFKNATPEACALLMEAADPNGDGRINMREFFMLFEKLVLEDDDDDDDDKSKSRKSKD